MSVERLWKVLVVDDSEALAFIIQVILQAAGHEVRTAKDAYDGYATFFTFRPDVVVTDIELPGESGLEMIQRIRRHEPKVRTIYVTADPDAFRSRLHDEQIKFRARLLRKPFSRAELVRLVSEIREGEPQDDLLSRIK